MTNLSTHAQRIAKSRMSLIPILPFVIPLLLLPLAAGWWWRAVDFAQFNHYREDVLFAYLIYIVIARFALLDLMLFYVSSKRNSMHLDLLHIVFLYLEITVITLLFFALLFNLFGVFELFSYNGTNATQHLLELEPHSLRVALFISVELFTTLGLGDWIPNTLNAMLASSIEALLGFVQSGVFFAVLIYAHQDRQKDKFTK